MITSFAEDEAALLPGDPTPANVVQLNMQTFPPASAANQGHYEPAKASVRVLSASQRLEIEALADKGRDAIIAAIRNALKTRSGKAWSVTGGRGTAWGWITVESPPARRTQRCRLKAGAVTNWPDDYEVYDSGEPGGSMTRADAADLAGLLGIEPSQCRQHWSIPSQRDFQRLALCRAMHGHDGGFTASANWD